MNKHRSELGILADGTKIESEYLSNLGVVRQARYAHSLTKLGERMAANNELIIGQAPLGFARARWTYEHMSKVARRGNSICNLIFVNDELLGITYSEILHASGAPMLISRPGKFNTKIEYQLSSPYRSDAEANLVVASSLVVPESNYWQWDFASSRNEQAKADAYAKLGMIAVADGSEWIYTVDNTGTKGAELWAKPPKSDDPEMAELMKNLNDGVMRIKAKKDDCSSFQS